LPPNRILQDAKLTLRPSLAFSYIGSVTARHLVVGVSQTAALNRQRHLCSAGRPSRWALAHISSWVMILAQNRPLQRLMSMYGT